MTNRTIFPVLLAVLSLRLAAQPALIPEAEALQPPTASRLAAIHAAAQRDGWAPQVAMLRAAAVRAYAIEKLTAAEAWYHVYRWAALLGQTQAEFIPSWVQAVNVAKVGYPGLVVPPVENGRTLARDLAPELQAWVIGNAAFSEEFFSLLAPVDLVPETFKILTALWRRDPAQFKTYANLALAIAVVYDVPPPPAWPHAQVTAEALPRTLPEPGAAFAWWIRQEKIGRTYHKLSRLGADELKFVVDAAAPFAELEWSQGAVNFPLNSLAGAYAKIRYRTDRVTGNQPVWPGASYRLADILATGGICADQAYFATQAGKARGVPTILIYGAGNDGRHAWFGFLDGEQRWQLDAGRHAEQRLVTGFARDPQTWREFSDHELKFLAERFHALPSFRQSRVHAVFAADFLAAGDAAAAAGAARKAVNFERRNQAGWEVLMAAATKQGRDAKTVEALMREAALAFQRYPDLEAAYANRVSASLRARGETSAADAEQSRIALKNQGARNDLAVQQARDTVVRAWATQPLPEQIRLYNHAVDTTGRGAGVTFFDQVVIPFAEHLLQLQQTAEAVKAVERAKRTLKVEPRSQLEQEIERLARAVKETK